MKKYGIKIDKRKLPNCHKVKIWVDKSETDYTTKQNAISFYSKKEAEYHLTESWEIIAEL